MPKLKTNPTSITVRALIARLETFPAGASVMVDLGGDYHDLNPADVWHEPAMSAGGCAPGELGAVMLALPIATSPTDNGERHLSATLSDARDIAIEAGSAWLDIAERLDTCARDAAELGQLAGEYRPAPAIVAGLSEAP